MMTEQLIPVKRKRGRPKKGERPVTPLVLMQIAQWYGHGKRVSWIARKLNVHTETIDGHLRRNILPVWAKELRTTLHEELYKLREVENQSWMAWQRSQKPEGWDEILTQLEATPANKATVRRVVARMRGAGDATFLHVLLAVVKLRAELCGMLIHKHAIRQETEIRIAGTNPAAFDADTIRLLLERIGERRENQKLLESYESGNTGGNGDGFE